jgi:hypothetical protein
MKMHLGFIASLIAATSLADAACPTAPARTSWRDFWRSVNVDPPPPESFLDTPRFNGKILNLTTGRLSDATVKRWIDAAMRRMNADLWIESCLRRDAANAGIFGPPGLNGSGEAIERERAKDVVRIDATGHGEIVAAGVIWLSKEDQRANPSAGYTEYVIVEVRRMTGRPRTRIFLDGTRESIGTPPKPGELRWWLETGRYYEHPVLGPLWYQDRGWKCRPEDGTRMGEICGRVMP